jgi:hypothetical protein
LEKAAKATLVGDVFDDAAPGQGCNYFLRAINSGASHAGRSVETIGTGQFAELRSGSFVKILKTDRVCEAIADCLIAFVKVLLIDDFGCGIA